MPSILDIRKAWGPDYDDLSDYEIAGYYAKHNRMSLGAASLALGLDVPDEPGLKSSLDAALGQTVRGVGRGLSDMGFTSAGRSVQNYGKDIIAANPESVNGFADFAKSPWQGFKEAVGAAAGSMGPGLMLQGAGYGLRAIPHPVAQALGWGTQALGAASIFAPEYGGIRDQQDENGVEDIGSAVVGAGLNTAIEGVLGPQALLRKLMSKGVEASAARAIVAEEFGKNPVRTALKQARNQSLGEASEELLQNPISSIAAHDEAPFDQKHLGEYAFGAFKAGVGTLPFGAYHGTRRGLMHSNMANDLREKGFLGDSSAPTDLLRGMENQDIANYGARFQDEATAHNAFLNEVGAPTNTYTRPSAFGNNSNADVEAARAAGQRAAIRNYNPVDTEFNDLLMQEQMDVDAQRAAIVENQQYQKEFWDSVDAVLADNEDFNDLRRSEEEDVAWRRHGLMQGQQQSRDFQRAFDKALTQASHAIRAGYDSETAVSFAVQQAADANQAYSAVHEQGPMLNALQVALTNALAGAPSLKDYTLAKNSETTVPPPAPGVSARMPNGVTNDNGSQVVHAGARSAQEGQVTQSTNPQGDQAQVAAGVPTQEGIVNATQTTEAPLPTLQEKAQPEQSLQVVEGPQGRDLEILKALQEGMTGAEVGKKFGIGRSRVSQIAKQHGIPIRSDKMAQARTDGAVAETVQLGELMGRESADLAGGEQGAATGFRIADTAGKINSSDIVEDKRTQKETKETNAYLKSVGATGALALPQQEVETADEIARREERAKQAKEQADAAHAKLLAHDEATAAAGDWDSLKSDHIPPFNKLTLGEQAEWVDTYISALNEDDHMAAIETAQREMEATLDGTPVYTANTGATGSIKADQGTQGPALESKGAGELGQVHPAIASAVAERWNDIANERGLNTLWDGLTESQQYHLISSIGDSVAEERAVNSVVKELQSKVGSDGTAPTVHANTAPKNPDHGKYTKLPKEFNSAVEAAQWLAKNSKSWWVRQIAAKIAPHLDGVVFVTVNDVATAPSYIRPVFERESGIGASALHKSGLREVFINNTEANGNTEENVLHELVHAATQRLMVGAAAAPFAKLAKAVQQSLSTWEGRWPINNKEHANIAEFFKNRFADPDEFVAYVFSSPTMQDVMKLLSPEGKWLETLSPTEQRANNKNSDAKYRKLEAVPEYTMWQKFADVVTALFGFPRKYRDKIEAVIQRNNLQQAENNRANTYVPTNIEETVNRLLTELLATDSGVQNASALESGQQRNSSSERNSPSVQLNVSSTAPTTSKDVATAFKTAFNATVDWAAHLPQGGSLRKLGLAMLTIRQMVKRYAGEAIGSSVKGYYDALKRLSAKAKHHMEEVRPLMEQWEKLNNVQSLTDALLKATTTGAFGDVDFYHKDNEHLWKPFGDESTEVKDTEDIAANRAEAKAKYEQAKAAYEAFVKANPSEKDVKLYRNVLDVSKRWMKKEYLLKARAAMDIHMPQLKALLYSTDYAKLEKLYSNLETSMTETRRQARELVRGMPVAHDLLLEMESAVDGQLGKLHELAGPYFPLSRFGDYIVVAKSKGFAEKQKALEGATQAIADFRQTNAAMQKIRKAKELLREYQRKPHNQINLDIVNSQKKVVSELVKAAGPAMKQLKELSRNARVLRSEVAKMSQDENHYRVEKHEGSWSAKRSGERQKANGFEVSHMAMRDFDKNATSASSSFINKLDAKLTARLPKELQGAASAAIKRTFIESLNDSSSLKKLFLNRKGVPGYSEDGLRVFGSFAMQGAHRLANIEHFVEMQDALDNVAKAAEKIDRATSGRNMEIANELLKRYVLDLDYSDTKWQNRIGAFNHVFTLGVTPSYILQNVLQTGMVAVPMITKRHSLTKTSAEFAKAWAESKDIIKAQMKRDGTFKYTVDIDSLNLTVGEKNALHSAFESGLLDILAEHDVAEVASGSTAWRKVGDVMDVVNWTARQVELHNRLTTALMAYRLELGRTKDHKAAVEYTNGILSDSQIDYSNDNAARWMKHNAYFGAKLLSQFKKYQWDMAYTVASNIGQAVKDAAHLKFSENGLTGTEAQRAVFGIFMTHFLMAGSVGLPLYAPVMAIGSVLSAITGGNDDDKDWKRRYANWLAEQGAAGQFLGKGLPALLGIDLSRTLGQGQLFNPLPFLRTSRVGAEQYDDAWMSLMPPVVGTGRKIVDGIHDFAEGRVYDGWSKVLPRWVAGIPQGMKMQEKGIVDKAGIERFSPDSFNAVDKAATYLGLSTTKKSDYSDAAAAQYEMEQTEKTRRAEILRKWDEGEDVSELRSEYDKNYSKGVNYKDLLEYRKNRKAKEGRVDPDTGLVISKKDRANVRERVRFAA